MADSVPREKNRSKICLYFKRGFCGYGENCLYKHGEPKSRLSLSNDPSDVLNCRFYKKASCKFASKCCFNHIRPKGKMYPRLEPLDEFIVVGPEREDPQETENTTAPVEESAASATIPARETGIRRHFTRPQNQNIVPKNCFYYDKEGTCYYGDKCWYSHSEPRVRESSDELLFEANPEPYPDHTLLCYNFIFDECQFGDECIYVHGDICQFCDHAFLHPFDEKRREKHLLDCENSFKKDMDAAFKFMVSKDKFCAICLTYIWEPSRSIKQQKFGIQDCCNHIFCLDCICHWRTVKRQSGEPKICPSCRAECSVIVPSLDWFESEKEKEKWIDAYKAAAKEKHCRFYKMGKCMDGDKCLFVHPESLPHSVRQQTGENWEDVGSNNPLPSVEQEGNRVDGESNNELQDDTGNLTEGAEYDIVDRDRQLQLSEIWDYTLAENTTNEDLVLQLGEQVNPSDLFDEHQVGGSLGHVSIVDEQNVERQVQQDPDNSDDTLPKDQSNEDLLLQSSEQISPSNLAEEIIEDQFTNSSGQVNVAIIDDQQDVEREVIQQDPDASFVTSSRYQL